MSRYIDLEELERRIKENVTTSGAGNTPYEVDLVCITIRLLSVLK